MNSSLINTIISLSKKIERHEGERFCFKCLKYTEMDELRNCIKCEIKSAINNLINLVSVNKGVIIHDKNIYK